MKLISLIAFCLICTPLFIFAQEKDPYSREWQQADSLLKRGFPESAATIVRDIQKKAGPRNQEVQMMKAEIFLLRSEFQRNEEAFTNSIRQAEDKAATSGFPANAIWHSIAGELYWRYYQNNRWKILERSATTDLSGSPDFELWDARLFFKTISSHYRQSLARSSELEEISIERYNALLEKGENTRHLRPSLFDLLAFRALEFFQNNEKDLTRPAFHFSLDDASYFSSAVSFSRQNIQSPDSTSLQLRALRIYQRLLLLHQDDARPDALIDADLHRLEFVYQYATLPDKKRLYQQALERIVTQYKSHPLAALAAVRAARLDMETNRATPYPDLRQAAVSGNHHYPAVRTRLQDIIDQYPGTEGARLARIYLDELLQKQLQLTTEEILLPNEPFRALVNYRNTPKLYARVVRLRDFRDIWSAGHHNRRALHKEILQYASFREWSVELPGTEDLAPHTTEIPIQALPTGIYALVISEKPSFATTENVMSYSLIQVSGLAAVTAEKKGFVLDRKTGTPLENINVDFYRFRYNDNIKGSELRHVSSVTSGKNGVFNSPEQPELSAIMLRQKTDTVLLAGYFYRNQAERERPSIVKTFFFTDRSIYRPGQTIYFKGITLSSSEGGRINQVLPDHEAEVVFYDANGQKISSQKLTTNEFGSFSGTFQAPQGVLTGTMRIATREGETYLSVEEYKRPTFRVLMDTLKASYKLQDTVRISGTASTYSGSVVPEATVRYRVVREARFPYWWYASRWGFPRSASMEITNGTTYTDHKGRFTINFAAIPDPSVAPESKPVFHYRVSVEVTDAGGETRNANSTVPVGYADRQIVLEVPGEARVTDLDTLRAMLTNLNSQPIPGDVHMKISRLDPPRMILRTRLWSMPDQFVLDSAEFKRLFPNDPYRGEDQPENWPLAEQTWQQLFRSDPSGVIRPPVSAWPESGWYLVEVQTVSRGDTLVEKRFVKVWNTRSKTRLPLALQVVPETQTVEPGQSASVQVYSAAADAFVIRQMKEKNMSFFAPEPLKGGTFSWSKTITEADRGGIAQSYVLVHNNRVYQEDAFIEVPWTNKELDISWETHRDELEPGEKETWTMVVRGSKKEKVEAEMVATLYDASLDLFRPHNLHIYNLYPRQNSYIHWQKPGFAEAYGTQIATYRGSDYEEFTKRYDRLRLFDFYSEYTERFMIDGVRTKSVAREESVALAAGAPVSNAVDAQSEPDQQPAAPSGQSEEQHVAPRENLNETAFFEPFLRTDAEGNIRIEFTMPEALTEWRLLGVTHTKDMRYGFLEGSVKTQKDLMVIPNVPRFLRQGDELVLRTRVNNLTGEELEGTAWVELIDALTGRPLELPFRLQQKEQKFRVSGEGSTTISWTLQVPESLYEPVTIRVLARAGTHTDGESHTIPVVSNRMMVTETLPLWVNGNGSKAFRFDKLLASDSSGSLVHHALTVEYTGNPIWYIVKALPTLIETENESAEQVFNRYYATALAAHIVEKTPKIKAIFDRWSMESALSSFSSPLERNQELKTALLEETPWVLEAQNETEQRKRIATLFETHTMARNLEAATRKLRDMQLPDGSFPWFKGMTANRHITQYIITGLSRLEHLGLKDPQGSRSEIIQNGLRYADRKMKESYEELLRSKVSRNNQHIGPIEIQYLYLRSFFSDRVSDPDEKMLQYFREQAVAHWPSFNPYLKGMIALTLKRLGNQKTVADIMQSLRETAIEKEEMGMYWMQRYTGWWWYQAPIEAQALLIEAFDEITDDRATVDKMRIWLLKNKQTQRWETTKATADAVYAMLLSGSGWLEQEPTVKIQLGDTILSGTAQKTEAGSGYWKTRMQPEQVKPSLGDITVTVSGNSNSTSWGAVYWQYFEDLDKISRASTPLEIRKQLFVQVAGPRGPELKPITSDAPIKIGDRVVIRLEILVDRDMEFVHLKDMRASGFEPADVISAYRWQSGLGYYESTRDLSTNFFFDHLRKGKYVFEYSVFASQSGEFSNGIATIQCMYAPEFSSHSEGNSVTIR